MKTLSRHQLWREANYEHATAYSKAYNKEKKPWLKESIKLYKKEWAKRTGAGKKSYLKNPAAYKAASAFRKKQVRRAAPKWLTREHRKEILQFYKIAEELRWLSEEPLHVDHIVPLRGIHVSGLHVPWNLQVLPASMNLAKGNKYETT